MYMYVLSTPPHSNIAMHDLLLSTIQLQKNTPDHF